MKILVPVLLLCLLMTLSSQKRISKFLVPDYDHTNSTDPKALSNMQKVLGRINYLLNTPDTDYEITRHWVQAHSGRNHWLWLQSKDDKSKVASVQLFDDANGKVRVVRAVQGLERPY
jgi:hypothetical protein